MAEMDAVEIADGEDAATVARGIVSGPGFGAGEDAHGGRPCGACRGSTGGGLRRRIHLHVKLQAIVGELDVMPAELAEALVGVRGRQIVSDGGEPGARGPELCNKGWALLDDWVQGLR